MAEAKSTAQVVVDYTTGELELDSVGSFDKFRKMRRDPTIALVRMYSVAPILASTWSVEGDNEEHVKFIEDQMLTIRTPLLRTALFAQRDFGWKAYEKTFDFRHVDFPTGPKMLQCIDKIKPLKNDDTRVRYKKETGEFMGLSTKNLYTGEKIFIDAEHSLFVNFDDEGLGNYADGCMQIVQATYDHWVEADEVAARYDKKMAGTFLVVYHPVGKTLFNGKETDNAEIAGEIIKALKSSGSVAIPVEVQDIVTDLQKQNRLWEITFLDPSGKQSQFVDRLKYLDALKARAFKVPERAVLEGEFGTKAEAGIHASAALLSMQLEHETLTEFFNMGQGGQPGLVNQLLRINYGTEGTAWLKANPLTDERLDVFQQLFTSMLADPGAGPDLFDAIDHEQLIDSLGLPMRSQEERDQVQAVARPRVEDPESRASTLTVSVA